jgi:hypothetical protein
MKTINECKQFNDWSAEWKDERKKIEADHILKLWQKPLPCDWEREIWEGKLGYRKRSDNKGEQCTEKELFNGGSNGFELVFSAQQRNANYRVKPIYHNMPLADPRDGRQGTQGTLAGVHQDVFQSRSSVDSARTVAARAAVADAVLGAK